MPEGEVLEFSGVTKRFGAVEAVSGFSARVEPGQVTGFLGPNGAGKTTTLRILLGLVRATSGSATIGGKKFSDLKHPMRTVGAVLEASSFHPGRSAANHLKVYAQAGGLPAARVDEALAAVGLTEVAGRKVGGFSLGMRQRLGLAGALLGDPGVIVLDEPSNGLDPEGIIWMRSLLRELARQGRTVFVSSHLLTEIQLTVDHLVIIARGRRVFQGGVGEMSDASEHAVLADSPDRAALSTALQGAGIEFETLRSGLSIPGADPAAIGRISLEAGVALSSLHRKGASLEDVFLGLVNGVRVHPSGQDGGAAPADGAVEAPLAASEVVAEETAASDEVVAEETAPHADSDSVGNEAADVTELFDEPAAQTEPADATIEGAPESTATTPSFDEPAVEFAPAGTESDVAGSTEAASVDSGDDDPDHADAEAAVAAEVAAGLDGAETPSAGAPAFTVASTGVIDVVSAQAEVDAETPEAPDADAEPAPQADTDADAWPFEESASDDAPRDHGTHEEGGDAR